MNFAKNRTLFPKRVLFSSRKIYEAGPMSGEATLLRSSPVVYIYYIRYRNHTIATSEAMLRNAKGFRPHGFQVKKMEYGRREETQTV